MKKKNEPGALIDYFLFTSNILYEVNEEET